MNGQTVLQSAYHVVFIGTLIILAIMLMLCLLRAILGPRVADRLVAVNMMGTMVMVMMAILTVMMKENYLADVALIYAMISFLAVVVLSKIYLGVYREHKSQEHRNHEKEAE